MYQFFCGPSAIGEGKVKNHRSRSEPYEKCAPHEDRGSSAYQRRYRKDYNCQIESYAEGEGILEILSENEDSKELPSRIWLFQGLPKSDKMEVIIQKAVELGAAGVIPVATRNAVVKLDAKKAEAKVRRWQAIAESAAKQSKRSYIPQVGMVMSLKEAFSYIEEQKFDLSMIPYELEKGMDGIKQVLGRLAPGQQIAVFYRT